MAWIIGWDLILEMLMAGSVISKYWGVYLNDFMRLMGWNANTNLTFGSFHIDIAPIIIVAFFTTLLVFGTKIGARVDGAMTVLKIAIVFFVVIVGFFYVKASNFTPFIPPSQPASTVEGSSAVTGVMTQPLWQFATGMTPSVYGVPGILSGAALVFFAFIGFDVVATASEETKNPHKNVPLGIGVGMLLIIVMYMLVAVVTTGMVSYADLAKQDSPSLATAFELVGADWAAKIISFGIVLDTARHRVHRRAYGQVDHATRHGFGGGFEAGDTRPVVWRRICVEAHENPFLGRYVPKIRRTLGRDRPRVQSELCAVCSAYPQISLLVLRRQRGDLFRVFADWTIGGSAAQIADFSEEVDSGILVPSPLVRQIILIEDGLGGTHRFACTAVDALVGVDVQRAGTLVNAVDGALVHASLVLDIHARLSDYIWHGILLNKY